MVRQLSEHRQKTELYLKIMNKALEVGDHQLACMVKNRLKHHHHQDYAIATPTGAVIIRFPNSQTPQAETPDFSYLPTHRPRNVWIDWAIGLSVFPGSFLAMLGLALGFLADHPTILYTFQSQ